MQLSFKQKIMASLLALGILPLMVLGGICLYNQYHQATTSTIDHTETAREILAGEVENFIIEAQKDVAYNATRPSVHQALKELSNAIDELDPNSVQVDAAALKARYQTQQEKTPGTKPEEVDSWVPQDAKIRALQHLYISANKNQLGEKQKLTDAGDGSTYSQLHAKYHPTFRSLVEHKGYYDFFLINTAGRVVYTDFKEVDFLSSVKEGPLATTNFSKTVQAALNSSDPESTFTSDFEPYMPSYNDWAAFVAAPIVENGKTIGAIAVQLSPERLSAITEHTNSIGQTGDAFLVGSDMKIRSILRTAKNKIGIDAPAAFVKNIGESLFSHRKPLSGEWTGVNGKTIIGSAAPLDIPGLDWGIVVRVEKDEIMAPIFRQMWIVTGLGIIMVLLNLGVGYWLSNMLVKPIIRLAQGFNTNAERVARSTGQVSDAVSGMIAASEETSTQSVVVRRNSTEAAGYVSSVSTAVEELNVSIHDISQSIGETNVLIDDAVEKARKTDEVVRNLGNAAQKISEIMKLINDLADQTNLLALNAAIEAARAGDAGRGFAVVADEVKKLASHTSNATVDISEQVKEIQDVSDQSIVALHAVVEAIHRIRDNATTVSAAVEEQSGVAKTIAGSVRDAAHRVHEVDSNMNGIEQAANDTGVAADQVSRSAGEVQTAFGEMKNDITNVLDEMGVKN